MLMACLINVLWLSLMLCMSANIGIYLHAVGITDVLQAAVWLGHLDTAKVLLEHGAQVSSQTLQASCKLGCGRSLNNWLACSA